MTTEVVVSLAGVVAQKLCEVSLKGSSNVVCISRSATATAGSIVVHKSGYHLRSLVEAVNLSPI